jgi:hypothetical protein
MSLNSDYQENHLDDEDSNYIYINSERIEYNMSDLISFYEDLLQRLKSENIHNRSLDIFAHAMHEHLQNPFKYNYCHEAAAEGDLIELKKMHQHGLPLFWYPEEEYRDDYKLCTIEAARYGHLDCLKYAHENGCEWNSDLIAYAAKNGHLDCLRYAFENGCQTSEYTTASAAEGGNLDCLRYVHENGCEWDSFTSSEAAENGHLDCLRYMHENGCEWNKSTTFSAAENGHLDCLKYAHENGCEWDEKSTSNAAENGHLDCLRYLIENGCPYDTKNEELVEKVKQVTKDIQTTKNIIKNAQLNDNVVNHIINKYI